jgi:hypothetical protein
MNVVSSPIRSRHGFAPKKQAMLGGSTSLVGAGAWNFLEVSEGAALVPRAPWPCTHDLELVWTTSGSSSGRARRKRQRARMPPIDRPSSRPSWLGARDAERDILVQLMRCRRTSAGNVSSYPVLLCSSVLLSVRLRCTSRDTPMPAASTTCPLLFRPLLRFLLDQAPSLGFVMASLLLLPKYGVRVSSPTPL